MTKTPQHVSSFTKTINIHRLSSPDRAHTSVICSTRLHSCLLVGGGRGVSCSVVRTTVAPQLHVCLWFVMSVTESLTSQEVFAHLAALFHPAVLTTVGIFLIQNSNLEVSHFRV